MRFKEYLKESEYQYLEDDAEIIDWLQFYNKRSDHEFTVDDIERFDHPKYEHMVSISQDIDISAGAFRRIAIQFYQTGSFNCSGGMLETLEGSPREVYGNFNCSANKLKDFIGAPNYCSGNMYFGRNPIESMKGIHEIIKQVNGSIWLPDTIKSGGIGLIMIEQLKNVFSVVQTKVNNPFSIIQKYLRQPHKLYDCQTELIDNGFEDYAIL